MSNQALKAALGRPFDPTPPTSELAGFHAPYAELTGDDVEGELRRELAGYGRVGITGVSGSGKSSLARYAADLDERFAPIYINVAGVTRTTRAEFGGSWFLTAKLAEDIATALAPIEGYRNLEQLAGTANVALDHIRNLSSGATYKRQTPPDPGPICGLSRLTSASPSHPASGPSAVASATSRS